ncbi:hypothetical protein P3T76_004201 [Phytophthora citrophthora]|uniref:PDZ domain-containing protein n=1 Tax=Phytophthora citrophthora TaxID=4793 RepID=A0AAD9LRN4_9STRA|nr:hypothetical protein P3T76_004201 [Phytophthora citrophthora]
MQPEKKLPSLRNQNVNLPMEEAAVERIFKALGLPRPFLSEPNRAFTQLETWQQLTALLATQPVNIKPLGYYRTPDSIDIYVFECSMEDASSSRRYSWKIYRRYRHFQKYIAHSSELLASRSVRVPRLSQAYLKIFHAQHCKDRLVELHHWLEGVAENTQSYCQTLQLKQEKQEQEKLHALQQKRLAQLEEQAKLKATRKQHKSRSSSNATTIRPDVPMTSMSTGRLRAPSKMSTATASTRRRSSISLKTIEQQGDPALYVLRTDKAEALPVVMLSCFLFAGANCPFPHVFRGMPSFAFALEELNVQLTQVAPAAYPSKLRNSMATRAGLGLRLTPSHEQEGQYLGATVAGFLRDQQELDPALVDVPVGAKLVRVNGIDISDSPFDQILVQLRSVGLPLRLRFVYNPHLNRQRSNSASSRSSVDGVSDGESVSGRQRVVSNVSGGSSSGNSTSPADGRPPMNPSYRSYSVDAPRSTAGLFGSVFGDLFGTGSGSEVSKPPSTNASSGIVSSTGKQRGETADIAVGSTHHVLLNGGAALFAWDDVCGGSRDLISRGFFSYLPPSLLHELRQKSRAERKAKSFLPEHDLSDSDESDDDQRPEEIKALMSRKAQGVWSTATGPMGFSFGACKICDVEAAMLEVSPVFFSSRSEHRGSEKRLCKGFILVSINNESTFGAPFATVIKRLRSASRPTSLCFRWYQDFSPFLETELAEQHGNKSSLLKPHAIGARVFVSSLDCVAEAQTDLSNSLQLALMENSSIRDEIGVLQDAHRELRLAQERAAQRERILQAKVEQSDLEIVRLKEEVDIQRQELEKSRLRAQEAEVKLATNKADYQAMLEKAQESAKARLGEHEEQLVKESNRSIENANRLAERRGQKMLEAAANESQRKHEEYLQKLAEEHSEEVESLMQQVAVWRHQVEVLTEAEKRNYAALVSNGVNPYGDYQRSRFGYSSTDSPFADLKSGNTDLQARGKKAKAQGSTTSTVAATAAKWRDGSPEEETNNQKNHTFSGTSDQSSQSNNGTFWDRMVSLLATE